MASAPSVDYYNTRAAFDKINPLIRSAYNNGSDFEQYKQKLLKKVEINTQNGHDSFLNSIEEIRREQRLRLAQVEREYYNQESVVKFDVPFYPEQVEGHRMMVTTKPPIPVASRRSPSPIFLTEEPQEPVIYHRPLSAVVVRHQDEDSLPASSNRGMPDQNTTKFDDSRISCVQNQIETMWDELELDDYMEKRKSRRAPSAPANTSWAGRVTVPKPFSLTTSKRKNNVHKKKCTSQLATSKMKKEIDDELAMSYKFKAAPVPAHVRMPLYEQLQEEQRARREEVRHMTKEYLNSISKPFGFDSRQSDIKISRRHSYSGQDTPRPQAQFRAKPLPDFYYRTSKDIELMKENSLYRSIKKEMRAKELLRQSRLPFSMQQRNHHERIRARSLSANDLTDVGLGECTFRPKTNGYYVPNFDKLHSEFIRETERAKKLKPSTKCKPFLLYTNMIPSRKEKVLDEIHQEEEMRYLHSFQIKGKQLPTKSTSGMDLSASMQQPEAIPTKTTEFQRLREALSKKKRREDEAKTRFEQKFQRSRSAREKRLKEKIHDRAKLKDQSGVYKEKREENNRAIRESMRLSEHEYARKLDDIYARVDRRPLLLEEDQRNRAVKDLERDIKRAMQIAKISEKDLIRQKFNPNNVRVTRVYSTDSM